MASIPIVFSLEGVSFSYEEGGRPVFKDFSIDLPEGVISLVGQNGTGKSTLLLLAAGRLKPQQGQVTIFDRDSSLLRSEEERNRYVSFIYQNLEFETEEPVGALLEYIYGNGFHESHDSGFIPQIRKVFELEQLTGKKTQELSKGELQRVIMAFSLLYGSRAIMMDEPIFALEEYQKGRVMGFMTDYAREHRIPLYYSAHELEITNKFSDYMLLLFRDNSYIIGPSKDVCSDENLERAFGIPRSMLFQKELLHRKHLREIQEQIIDRGAEFN